MRQSRYPHVIRRWNALIPQISENPQTTSRHQIPPHQNCGCETLAYRELSPKERRVFSTTPLSIGDPKTRPWLLAGRDVPQAVEQERSDRPYPWCAGPV